MFIHKKDGHAVRLLEQTAESNAVYSRDGAEPVTVRSHQFFSDFREATADELPQDAPISDGAETTSGFDGAETVAGSEGNETTSGF